MGCILNKIRNNTANQSLQVADTNTRSKPQLPLSSLQKLPDNQTSLSKINNQNTNRQLQSNKLTIVSAANSQTHSEKKSQNSRMTSRKMFLKEHQHTIQQYQQKYQQITQDLRLTNKLKKQDQQILRGYLLQLKYVAKTEEQLGYNQKALKNHMKYLQIAKIMRMPNNSDEIVLAQKNIAWLQFRKGNIQQTSKVLQSFLQRLGTQKQTLAHSEIIVCQAKIKYIQQQYTDALTLYEHSYRIQRNSDSESVFFCNTLSDLGLVHSQLKNYQQAISFYQKGLKIAKKLKGQNSIEYAKILGNLGNTFFQQQKYSRAREAYDECLGICQENNQTHSRLYVNALCCLGNLCLIQKNYEEALRYYEQAKQIQKYLGSKSVTQTLGRIMKCHQQLGNQTAYTKTKAEYHSSSQKSIQPS